MKLFAITLSLLSTSVISFSPSPTTPQTTTLSATNFDDVLGVQAPLGLYDPLGLLDDADEARFSRLRYVEIKHGRISMLAFLGNIVTRAGLHLPGSIDKAGDAFSSYPNGYKALTSIPEAGLFQLVAFVGFLELFVMRDVTGTAEFPGDLRNDSLDFGWDSFDEEQKLFKRGVELNNGRAAMMGILGLMVHEQLGGALPIVGEM